MARKPAKQTPPSDSHLFPGEKIDFQASPGAGLAPPVTEVAPAPTTEAVPEPVAAEVTRKVPAAVTMASAAAVALSAMIEDPKLSCAARLDAAEALLKNSTKIPDVVAEQALAFLGDVGANKVMSEPRERIRACAILLSTASVV